MKKLRMFALCILCALCFTMAPNLAFRAEAAQAASLTDYSKGVMIYTGTASMIRLSYASLTDGASVYVDDSVRYRSQWAKIDEGNGYVSIRPITCLDMALTVANDSPNNTAPIQLSYYTGGRSQLFKLEFAESYFYKITTKSSNNSKCIEVRDSVPVNGSRIQQYTYTGADRQQWDIANYNYALCNHTFSKGVCQKCNAKLGDVNEDGIVNDADATTLLRHIGQWNNQAISSELSDIDRNGIINDKDATYLQRIINGSYVWPN